MKNSNDRSVLLETRSIHRIDGSRVQHGELLEHDLFWDLEPRIFLFEMTLVEWSTIKYLVVETSFFILLWRKHVNRHQSCLGISVVDQKSMWRKFPRCQLSSTESSSSWNAAIHWVSYYTKNRWVLVYWSERKSCVRIAMKYLVYTDFQNVSYLFGWRSL